jgi:hypothetical protein
MAQVAATFTRDGTVPSPRRNDMATSRNYQAFWVPGLDNNDVDADEALLLAFDWLRRAEREHGGAGVLVMNASLMRRNRPLLESAPWDIFSPRTHRPRGRGPALAIWPSARALEFAESLAFGTALCVVPGTLFDIAPWIRRTGAACLAQGFDVEAAEALSAEVRKLLDHMLSFDGHNGFLGGGGKEYAIRTLREILRRPDAPSSDAIEEYLAGSGETNAKGAARAAKWYDEIRAGRRHLDYARRTI